MKERGEELSMSTYNYVIDGWFPLTGPGSSRRLGVPEEEYALRR